MTRNPYSTAIVHFLLSEGTLHQQQHEITGAGQRLTPPHLRLAAPGQRERLCDHASQLRAPSARQPRSLLNLRGSSTNKTAEILDCLSRAFFPTGANPSTLVPDLRLALLNSYLGKIPLLPPCWSAPQLVHGRVEIIQICGNPHVSTPS